MFPPQMESVMLLSEREVMICSSSDAEGELGSMTRISAVSLPVGLGCGDLL